MGNISLTLQGLVAQVIGLLLLRFGLPKVPDEVEVVSAAVIITAGWVAAYVGRVRKGDINWYGKRK